MSILIPDDFLNGRKTIPANKEQVKDLQLYIDDVEFHYLPRLFGKVLYDLFIADLALAPVGDPTTARFIKIFNPFTEQTDEVFCQSVGIKEMLKGLVYYHYVSDDTSKVTTTGTKLTLGENSENVSAIHHNSLSRYNNAIETYKAIQWWMSDQDAATYPEYEGIVKNYNHPF